MRAQPGSRFSQSPAHDPISILPTPIVSRPRSPRRRKARGEKPVGWKIGFTNSAIWADQGLNAPIWGPMYDATVSSGEGSGCLSREPPARAAHRAGDRLASREHSEARHGRVRTARVHRRGDARIRDRAVGLSRVEAQTAGCGRCLRHARRLPAWTPGPDSEAGSRALVKNARRLHRRAPSRRCGDGSRRGEERARRTAVRPSSLRATAQPNIRTTTL